MELASCNTVLIIEDERDVIDLLALNLRKAQCRDGKAAKARWLNESVCTEMQQRRFCFLQRRTWLIVARKFWSTLVEIAPLWDLSAVLGISIGLSIREFRSVAVAVAHFSDDCKKRNDQKQYVRNSI
jgi:hypothetical protein